jgi:hypothetical protein
MSYKLLVPRLCLQFSSSESQAEPLDISYQALPRNQLYQVRLIAYKNRPGGFMRLSVLGNYYWRTRPYRNYIYLTAPDIKPSTVNGQLSTVNCQLFNSFERIQLTSKSVDKHLQNSPLADINIRTHRHPRL